MTGSNRASRLLSDPHSRCPFGLFPCHPRPHYRIHLEYRNQEGDPDSAQAPAEPPAPAAVSVASSAAAAAALCAAVSIPSTAAAAYAAPDAASPAVQPPDGEAGTSSVSQSAELRPAQTRCWYEFTLIPFLITTAKAVFRSNEFDIHSYS